MVEKIRIVVTSRKWELIGKRHKITFWVDGNDHALDRVLDYKGVCICHYS